MIFFMLVNILLNLHKQGEGRMTSALVTIQHFDLQLHLSLVSLPMQKNVIIIIFISCWHRIQYSRWSTRTHNKIAESSEPSICLLKYQKIIDTINKLATCPTHISNDVSPSKIPQLCSITEVGQIGQQRPAVQRLYRWDLGPAGCEVRCTTYYSDALPCPLLQHWESRILSTHAFIWPLDIFGSIHTRHLNIAQNLDKKIV